MPNMIGQAGDRTIEMNEDICVVPHARPLRNKGAFSGSTSVVHCNLCPVISDWCREKVLFTHDSLNMSLFFADVWGCRLSDLGQSRRGAAQVLWSVGRLVYLG